MQGRTTLHGAHHTPGKVPVKRKPARCGRAPGRLSWTRLVPCSIMRGQSISSTF